MQFRNNKRGSPTLKKVITFKRVVEMVVANRLNVRYTNMAEKN